MWGWEPLPSPVCVGIQRANGAVTSSQRHSAAVHLAVHPPAREAGYTETVDGESDAGSRSDCISGFNEGHGDQLCPATRRAHTTILELSGLDKGRHALPSLRACSTRADSSFHFVSALLARRCVSSTWAGVTVGVEVSVTGKGFTHLSFFF